MHRMCMISGESYAFMFNCIHNRVICIQMHLSWLYALSNIVYRDRKKQLEMILFTEQDHTSVLHVLDVLAITTNDLGSHS